MKKIYVLASIIMMSLSYQSFAQITVSADTVRKEDIPGSFPVLKDTLTNSFNFAMPISWNMSPASSLATGHAGIGLCFLPGACYQFNNNSHIDNVNANGKAYFSVDLQILNTSQPGEKSIVILNTDINGGKDLVFILTTKAPDGITELDPMQLSLSPNPTQNNVHITWKDKISGNLILNDIFGRQVMNTRVFYENSSDFTIERLSQGIYNCQLIDENGKLIASHKLIKN